VCGRQFVECGDILEGGHVLLATVYYRSGRKEDGDRERAVVEKLKASRKEKELAEQQESPGEGRP